jgi:tagatose-6-phosphate ketose/aldose isomerase
LNELAKLLSLSEEKKTERGLLYTPAEIAQQPSTWQATFSSFRRHRAALEEFLDRAGFGDPGGRKPTVFLVGAGSSDYVGRSLVHLFRRRWKCEVLAVPSTGLLTHEDEWLIAGQRYLWISFSRSGDSPESLAVLENSLAHHPDVHHIVVSCNAEGRMIRCVTGKNQAFPIVLPVEVNDRGLAMTSSFSNMVVLGQCLAHWADLAQYEPVLHRLAEAGASFLPLAADAAAALAAEPFAKICFLGSGALEAVAVESRLKVLELSAGKIVTMAESFLGLRHGPMAALDKSTLLVAFLANDEKVARYEKDLLRELSDKQLVQTQVIVGARPESASDSLAGKYLLPLVPEPVPREPVPDDCRPPLDVIFGQLLGLFFSLRCGLTPDQPSPNGAISRVVQDVKIYA